MKQDTEKDIKCKTETAVGAVAEHSERVYATQEPKKPAIVWAAVVLALAAWAALLFANGYVALGIGVAGAVVGIWGASSNRTAMRRLSVTAVIVSTVLVVVLAAFLVVIKIGLS